MLEAKSTVIYDSFEVYWKLHSVGVDHIYRLYTVTLQTICSQYSVRFIHDRIGYLPYAIHFFAISYLINSNE